MRVGIFEFAYTVELVLVVVPESKTLCALAVSKLNGPCTDQRLLLASLSSRVRPSALSALPSRTSVAIHNRTARVMKWIDRRAWQYSLDGSTGSADRLLCRLIGRLSSTQVWAPATCVRVSTYAEPSASRGRKNLPISSSIASNGGIRATAVSSYTPTSNQLPSRKARASITRASGSINQ
jgi:hypothetical protein